MTSLRMAMAESLIGLGNISRKSDYYDEDEDRFEIVTDIADDMPYEKISLYYCVFLDKEKAQAYCDWLNEREKEMNAKF